MSQTGLPRHLVLSENGGMQPFCGGQPEPYDSAQHTIFTVNATCEECLVVHAAWATVRIAELED